MRPTSMIGVPSAPDAAGKTTASWSKARRGRPRRPHDYFGLPGTPYSIARNASPDW